MTRKTLVVLAILAIALVVLVISTDAMRGGMRGGSGGMGGSGGGISPVPDGNYDNGNYDNGGNIGNVGNIDNGGNFDGNYDASSGGCGNYELPPGNYGPGNYEALGVCVSTDKRMYAEGEPIEIEVTAYNPLESVIRLVSSSGPPLCGPAGYTIDGIGPGSIVPIKCAGDVIYTNIPPKSSRSWAFTHTEGVFPVEVGRHNIVGWARRQSDPTTINVLGPIDGDSPETVPTVAWIRTYDAAGYLVARGVAVDSDDNVIVAGYSWFQGMEPGYYYTIKYDSSGNQLWVKAYGAGGMDEAYGVAVDSAGNVYVAGTSGTIKYDFAGNQLLWTGTSGKGVAVDSSDNVIVTGTSGTIKYDSNGNQLWTGTGGRGVAVDSGGNVIVTGRSDYANYDYYTIKYDSNGNQLWAKTYGGDGVAVDPEGNVIVTGSGTIKYDSNGNQLWTASYGGRGVAVDSDGNVYVTGTSNADYLTIQYDSDGNQLLNLTYDGGSDDWAYGVAVDSEGNVIVTGSSYFRGRIDYLTIKYVMPAANMHML